MLLYNQKRAGGQKPINILKMKFCKKELLNSGVNDCRKFFGHSYCQHLNFSDCFQ